MFRELLIEIGCEEMPARWLPLLRRQLGELLGAALDDTRLEWTSPVQVFATPRRLAVSIAAVAPRQRDVEETVTGPPVRAAFGPDGQPTKAAIGFARKYGVRVEDLERMQTKRGEYLGVTRRERGEKAAVALPVVLTQVLRRLTFPKQMNWDARLKDGAETFLFGRPIRWLLFLYDGKVVPYEILRSEAATSAGVRTVKAAAITYGHRIFSRDGTPGRPLRVRSLDAYKKALAANYVVIERDVRRARIARKLVACAKKVGGEVAANAARSMLLDDVPDLVEYPSVVTGTFPEEFLILPDEVLKTTMIHHQHYFPIARNGRLTPHFLAVTNTPRDNVARIARNSERVLIARLRDARFFWDADRKGRLDDRLDRLDTLLFHKKLGSYRQKTERTSALASRIASELLDLDPEAAAAAGRAGLLCKADLATDMVGEFPELQGQMGGVYAREQGEPERVWRAVYHHYLPVGVVATDPPSRTDLGAAAATWAAVALADKLDTLVGLFQAGERPTGSRDPLGLRRQAQGVIRVLIDLPELTGLSARVSLGALLRMAGDLHGQPDEETQARQTSFVRERLRSVLEERGGDVRNVRAVTHQASLDDVCPLDARRKLEVLPEFTGSERFQQLATVFKRVKHIARELGDRPDATVTHRSQDLTELASRLTEPAERALLDELTRRGAAIDTAITTGTDYRGAFGEASQFGLAVDRFFNEVFVMVDDMSLRDARLRLMRRLEETVELLADVSELVPEASGR